MKRVVLIGAGHAHLVVLRGLAEKPLYGARITLVNPRRRQVYSGMLPGIVAGHYRREEAEIDVARLAERAGVGFEEGELERLDAQKRLAFLKGGGSGSYDFASVNVGSRVDDSLPGAVDNALAVKPYDEFLTLLPVAQRIAIVGAGAAGAELAMALHHRGAQVTLYADKPVLAARVVAELRKRKIDYREGMPVTSIVSGPLVITGSATQAFDLVLLATGAVAPAWLGTSGLATDERGFALVHDTLQSVSHQEVFALGDCATLRSAPHAKSGVYAVRHGETFLANLRRFLVDMPLELYRPQEKALTLLSCGARYAIAQRGDWSAQGRWVWWWKNAIDRRWVRSFA